MTPNSPPELIWIPSPSELIWIPTEDGGYQQVPVYFGGKRPDPPPGYVVVPYDGNFGWMIVPSKSPLASPPRTPHPFTEEELRMFRNRTINKWNSDFEASENIIKLLAISEHINILRSRGLSEESFLKDKWYFEINSIDHNLNVVHIINLALEIADKIPYEKYVIWCKQNKRKRSPTPFGPTLKEKLMYARQYISTIRGKSMQLSNCVMLRDAERYLWGLSYSVAFDSSSLEHSIAQSVYNLPKLIDLNFGTNIAKTDKGLPYSPLGGDSWYYLGQDHYLFFYQKLQNETVIGVHPLNMSEIYTRILMP